MKSRNKLTILGVLLAVFLSLSSIDALAAAITWDGGAGTSNWNDANNWSGNAVPTSSDDVTLNNATVVTAYTVVVNTAADVNSLVISETAGVTLKPDASSGRTMRIRDFLTLTAGTILYTNSGGTGRLSWTFDGAGAINRITNSNAASQASKLQFANLTIDGAITTPAGDNDGDMEIYGTLTVNGTFITNNNNDDSHVYFKGSSNTILNNGSLELYDVTFNNNSVYTTATDFTVNGDMTVASGSSLTIQTPAIVTLDGDTKTLTNSGTLAFNTGASLNVNETTTLVGDLLNFNADLTVLAAKGLTVTATNQISGTGSITTGAASVITVNDGDGVAGAIDLDTYSWSTATDYVIQGGKTGFTAASITTIDDLTFGTNTGSALAITVDGGFTMSGNIVITANAGGVTTVTATSGTINMTGTKAITTNGEVIDFYGLNINGTTNTVTIEADRNIIINNFLGVATGNTLTAGANTGTDVLTFDGTANVDIDGTLTVPDNGQVEITGSVTLQSSFTIGTFATAGGVNVGGSATLDFGAFTLTLAGANGVFDTAPGTILKTAAPTGLAGNLTTDVAITIDPDVDLVYNSGATSLGLFDIDGQGTNVLTVDDVTIAGAAITTTGSTASTVVLTGNFTLTTGTCVFAAAADVISMGSGGAQSITNSQAAASLDFQSLVVTAGTVTTSSDFKISGDVATALSVTGGVFTASSPSTIYFEGSTGTQGITGGGAIDLYNVSFDGTGGDIDIVASATDVDIAGNFTITGANGVLGAAASNVDFNGTAAQTIETGGFSLSLDIVTISNSVGVSTNDNMTFGNNNGVTTLSGKFIASAGTVTKAGTGNLTVSGNSSTFFNLAITAATAANTGNYSIIKNLSGAGTFDPAGTVTFYGDPADLDATTITDDDKQISAISITTLGGAAGGNVVVTDNCELQVSVAMASTLDYNVDGRIELTATAAAMAGAGVMDLTYGDGGTLHLSGTNVNGLDDAVETNGTLTTDATSDIIFEGQATDVGFGTRTVGNITFDNTAGAIILNATDIITVGGNIIQNGPDFGTSNATSNIILSGASSDISGSGTFSVGLLSVAATATGATASASIDIRGAAGAVTLTSGGSFVHTGVIAFNNAAATIVNNGSYDDLVLGDVTVAAALASSDDFSIGGSLTTAAVFTATTNEIYFTGTNETITTGADNQLNLVDVTFTGSYGLAGNFIVNISSDLEVTNTGSFDMNTVGTLDFDGTGSSTITNDGNLTINIITITGGTDLFTTDNFTVEGNFTNTASNFVASGTSLITFDGTTVLTGTALNTDTQFNDITVEGTVTQTNDILLNGNLIVNGTYAPATANVGTTDDIFFGGGTTKTIQNNGTLTFGNLTINNVASNAVTTSTDMSVAGFFEIAGTTGGSFVATGGTVTFMGGGLQSLLLNNTAATNLKFYGLTLSGASTQLLASANSDFYVNSDLTLENNAQLECQSNNTRIYFGGTSQQDINLTGTGVLGTSAQLLAHNITLNNTGGLRLVGTTNDIMLSQFDVEGTLFLQSGDIDLNGNNILTIDADAGGKLFEPASGGRVLNNGPSTSTGYVYADLSAPGAVLSSNDIGGLGAYITTTADPGATVVKRYHIPLTVGASPQASRYYSITNANASIGGKLAFKYDTDELGTLTEDDLILVYGDDPAVDVWTIEPTTLNTSTKRLTTEPAVVGQFTGQTEWWTIGSPDVLSASTITNGLASTPINAGTNDNAIFGVQFTSNGTIDLSTVKFNLGRALGATNEASNWTLVYSEDDDYSTTEDNTVLIDVAPGGAQTTGGQSGDNYITFDVSSEDDAYISVDEGTPVNYFLVADIVSTVTASTSTITPSTNNLVVTVSGGISEEFSLTGSAYSFRPSIMVSPHEVGITDNPLVANQEDVVLFGFKATVSSNTGLPGITGFALDMDTDPTDVFENVQVYASTTDNNFANMGGGNLISTTTASVSSSGFNFVFTAKKQLATTPTYFFVVADVKAGVNSATPDITPTLTYADLTSTDAGVRGTDIDGNTASSHSGYVYTFVNNTVTVSTANNPASSNLGTKVDRQPIFGFTLTPDNGQEVVFTGANITVTLSSAAESSNLSNWSLYYDSNENGYPEVSEKIDDGVLTATSGDGNLTFAGFTQTLTSARKYLVGVKVGSGATAGTTIKTQLTSADYIALSSPATLNAAGPLPATANTHTIRTAGTATALQIVHNPSSVTTGNALAVTVRSVDANGYPANVTAAETVTIAKVSGTGTVGGTTTGTIANGTNIVVVSPTITAASGSTDLVINATGSSLTSSSNTSAIKVLEAEPVANDAVVTIANITATTARITNLTANSGSTDGRIVVIRQGSAPEAPTDGVAYTASLDITDAGAVGTGQTGAGSYVVMANVAAAAAAFSNDIEGLMPNTRYYVQVFDYNGTTPNFNYATGTAFTNETTRNPISFTTSTGDISSGVTESAPANIQTDIDINSTISAANEIDWYQFRIPSTRNNVIIRLSNLPANYQVELYDASAGLVNKTLLRDSKVTGTGDEVIILKAVSSAGPYVLKIYGVDDDAYSSSNYTLRVTTSTTEIFSQVE